MAIDKETLARWQLAMDRRLQDLFPAFVNKAAGVAATVALYWPHRNEYDPRGLAEALRQAGAKVALPAVDQPASALQFRAWPADVEMVNGPHGIPQPAGGEALSPSILVLPAVGFDAQGYRLGYGGGYFDRTLAAMAAVNARPLVVATAFEMSRLDTVFPQPHDIPVDWVVTEAAAYRRTENGLVAAEAAA